MSRPTYNVVIDEKYFVEALAGPNRPASYLDNFPNDIYDTSSESRLYKFLYTLLGPIGVGFLKLNYFYARLQLEEHGLQFDQLDKLYNDPFRFARRFDESYLENWKGVLDNESWNLLRSLDESYRQRATDYFHAARLGPTPEGMRFAARSALGFDVKIVENYQHLFNKHNDQILNYNIVLKSNNQGIYNTEKFTIAPNGYIKSEYFDLDQNNNVVQNQINLIGSETTDPESLYLLEHAIENIKPVNVIYDLDNGQSNNFELNVKSNLSSSDFYYVTTFVTGNTNIDWPKSGEIGTDFNSIYWVEAGIEKESPRHNNDNQQHYQGFYKIPNISASSYAIGSLNRNQALINKFPVLNDLPASKVWSAEKALSAYPEPLTVTRQNNTTNTAFINGQYPIDYMDLNNVSTLKYEPNTFWISGLKTVSDSENDKEYLEIDLNATKAVNFLIFEILSAPLEINIYYDALNIQEILPSLTAVSCNLGQPGSTTYTYTTSSAHNLIIGDSVTISKINGSNNVYYNGTFKVINVDENNFTVSGLTSGLQPVSATNLQNAIVEKNLQEYKPVVLDPLYPADEILDYDSNALNKWHISPFTFTDTEKKMIFTRFIKIEFDRNAVNYKGQSSFLVDSSVNPPIANPWPVVVKNLRLGRNII